MRGHWIFLVLFLVGSVVILEGFSFFGPAMERAQAARVLGASLNVSSHAFLYGIRIPLKYTCDCSNTFPPLSWEKGPWKTKSYVVMCVNPDVVSGEIVLWIVYNIPASRTSLPEGFIDPDHSFGDEAAVIQDGILQVGSRGIFLPKNYPLVQEYYFIVFALDSMITPMKKPVTKEVVFDAIKGHELAAGICLGLYAKEPEVIPLFRR